MLDSAWTGEFEFFGQQVHRMKPKDRVELNKKYIGFVFQSYHLIDHLTVYENLDIPLSYRDIKKSERDCMVCDILDRFHIVGKKDLYPSQLSGGQQQLVAVARAVIANPKLILADEPTGNLHSEPGQRDHGALQEAERRGHDDHPGHALGDERVVRQPCREPARRVGGGRVEAVRTIKQKGRRFIPPTLIFADRDFRRLAGRFSNRPYIYQRGSFRRPPLKSPSSKLRPPPPPPPPP